MGAKLLGSCRGCTGIGVRSHPTSMPQTSIQLGAPQHHHGARSSSIHPPTIPLVVVPLAPITGFSLPALVLQLFGFVYACYVSKVFLEEEDSCECLCY